MRWPLTLEQRFWSKVEKRSGDECWIWRGSRFSNGYGLFPYGTKKRTGAHRMSWKLTHGRPVPDGLLVLHSCDVKDCVNPSHLHLGTLKDNATEAVDRGLWGKRGMAGSKNPRAKLNDEQVKNICLDDRANSHIAKDYGISNVMVGLIKNKKAWRHLHVV